jgi:polyferredoxin
MGVAFLSTALWFASAVLPESSSLHAAATGTRKWYGLVVTASLSGAVGTGLYPIGGTRVWCRNFCPMAAFLGIIQKLGRFRIRVKKEMCISCGLCSKYCEMGIDVRSYAQAGLSFTRASCVGCGMCAEVCPRGVLRLENSAKVDPQELSLVSFLDESWKGAASSVAAKI